MKVIAIRNSGTDRPPYVAEVGLTKDLRAFASRADVIVDTLPLTPDTKGLFDKGFFDAAKRGALFINVGRGGTVVTADLIAALKDGRVGGAGLDVTDPEPLPADHPLWQAPNVIITPHVSAALEGNEEPRWLLARENLRRYVAGDKLLSEVDVERLLSVEPDDPARRPHLRIPARAFAARGAGAGCDFAPRRPRIRR